MNEWRWINKIKLDEEIYKKLNLTCNCFLLYFMHRIKIVYAVETNKNQANCSVPA
jgi:hypothetical protein